MENLINVENIISTYEASKILKISQNRVQGLIRSKILIPVKVIGKNKTILLNISHVIEISKQTRKKGNPAFGPDFHKNRLLKKIKN